MNFNYLFTSFALNLRTDGTYEPFSAEAWKYAGQMTLLGIAMVFAVLAVLSAHEHSCMYSVDRKPKLTVRCMPD